MKRKLSYFICVILLLFGVNMHAATVDKENLVILELKNGTVEIELLPKVAPKHVARFKELIKQGFYDGLSFHRVISGFMAQTGDPKGDGTGGSGKKLEAEFSDVPHIRGTLSMARAMDPNSADSQFFIVFADAPHLNGQYTVFGKVVKGMEFVDKIKKGSSMANGSVTDPDKIIYMKMATDNAEF